MLTELRVSRFAIIDSIHIFFDHGLNILSGETGAGKIHIDPKSGSAHGSKTLQPGYPLQCRRGFHPGGF